MPKTAVIPGSFNPPTNGHLDMIKRTARIFDDVVVLVMQNAEKKYMFTDDERFELTKLACKDIPNVRVESFGGLLCDYVEKIGADVIIKGIRNSADYEYEKDMAQINFNIGGCETLLITAKPELEFCSSTFVREMLRYGRDISKYVPENCLEIILGK